MLWAILTMVPRIPHSGGADWNYVVRCTASWQLVRRKDYIGIQLGV